MSDLTDERLAEIEANPRARVSAATMSALCRALREARLEAEQMQGMFDAMADEEMAQRERAEAAERRAEQAEKRAVRAELLVAGEEPRA